jgi:hypothetical protein
MEFIGLDLSVMFVLMEAGICARHGLEVKVIRAVAVAGESSNAVSRMFSSPHVMNVVLTFGFCGSRGRRKHSVFFSILHVDA